MPTTAQLLTAPARGGIAVILLHGPDAAEILAGVFRPRAGQLEPGRLCLGWIGRGQEALDECIVCLEAPLGGGQWRRGELNPSPAYQPPRWAEINIHGGPQVGRAVLGLLRERGAEVSPGGDDATLAQAHPRWGNPAIALELLAALPRALTPLATACLANQWSGGVSALAREALACLGENAAAFAQKLSAAAGGLPLMRRLLAPARVVLAGPPNVGKSSLANALAGRTVSVVADQPGTTRDWVCTLAEADGTPIELIDTAGLWEENPDSGLGASADDEPRGGSPEPPPLPASDHAERGGSGDPPRAPAARDDERPAQAHAVDHDSVRRAWQRVSEADLVLCVTAGATRWGGLVARLRGMPNVLEVRAKIDLAAAEQPCSSPASPCSRAMGVSSRTGAGLPELRAAIRRRLGLADIDPAAPMAFTERQAELLSASACCLERGELAAARERLLAILEEPAAP